MKPPVTIKPHQIQALLLLECNYVLLNKMVALVAFKLFELCIVIIIVAVTIILRLFCHHPYLLFMVWVWILFQSCYECVRHMVKLNRLNWIKRQLKATNKGRNMLNLSVRCLRMSDNGTWGNISLCEWVCAWFDILNVRDWVIAKMKANWL